MNALSTGTEVTASGHGLFVTFEGIEGAGKTTQAKLLTDALAARGLPVELVREPGATPLGEAIRRLLLDPQAVICPAAETLLFLAARAQNVADRIWPALEQGATVVCDRFSDSTLAYQGYARNVSIEAIRTLTEFSTGGLWPDLTILLDVDVNVGLTRQQERNRMEDEPVAFHEMVRLGYLQEAQREPSRFAVLDASQDSQTLHSRILDIVLKRIGGKT